MLKGIFVFLLASSICISTYARNDKLAKDTLSTPSADKNLRISLLTCGFGNVTWQAFGHTAIRIVDNSKDSLHKDLTYNYGIFDAFEGSFEKQFIRGRVRVFLKAAPYDLFIKEYIQEGRSVEERILLLDNDQKEKIQAFLENNALIENRYYTYHIFYDNCTIRVRDMLLKTLGKDFVLGQVIPKNVNMTFHEACELYLANKYWFRICGNVFFGSKADIKMSNQDIMFLPEFLDKGLEGATINGKKVCADKAIILKNNVPALPGINAPLIITCLIAVLTIAGLSYKRLRILGRVMIFVVLLISSLAGLGILYAWFGSGYDLCSNNYNILWALPTNIILPLLPSWIQAKYALVAMCLICMSLIVHITGIQVMLLFELVPFWLALFFVYGMIYRMSRNYSERIV